jgi:hypothetical protein
MIGYAINVYDTDKRPIRVSNKNYLSDDKYINLLVIEDHIQNMNINHYVYIKKLDVFASNNKYNENGTQICKNRFICNRYLYPFSSKDRLEKYIKNGCDKFEPTRIGLPKSKFEHDMEIKPTIAFNDFRKKIPIPVFITADFETLIQPSNNVDETNKTVKVADLPPCSY